MPGMIQVDPRVGSRELLKYFTKNKAVISGELSADFEFLGNGPDGVCNVGIERKQMMEFIADFPRFANNQLYNMLQVYDFCYLALEGPYQPTPDKHIEVWETDHWNNRLHNDKVPEFKTFMGRVYTLINRCNFHVIHTVNEMHTAYAIEALYNWYQKPWDTHTSYNIEYTPPPPPAMPRVPTIMEKMLVQIPSVGWTKAIAIAAEYKSVQALCIAQDYEIADIVVGKQHVGEKSARMIKRYINGG